eukprot:1160246-Pelagomonas_calceolata.AAC.3
MAAYHEFLGCVMSPHAHAGAAQVTPTPIPAPLPNPIISEDLLGASYCWPNEVGVVLKEICSKGMKIPPEV